MRRVDPLLVPSGPRLHGDASGEDGPAAVDFAVNLNPYGPQPALLRAAREAELLAYPDATALELRRAFAEWLGGGADEYIFAAGACTLLWTAAQVLHRCGAPAVIAGPTFSEYAAAVGAMDAEVVEFQAQANDGFRPDVEQLASAAHAVGAASLYLCNPNNPTGVLLGIPELARLAGLLGACTLVLDESFLALTSSWRDLRRSLPSNVLRVRSLTKEYGLAGLRLGYARGSVELIARLEGGRAPWATSAPALAAGLVIPGLEYGLAEDRERLGRDRLATERSLEQLGFQVFPGAANFTLARHALGQEFPRTLLAQGVRVRDCSSFGLPGYLRLAARPAGDRERLFGALGVLCTGAPTS